MEGEINKFIKIWVSIFLSVCYCFVVAKILPKGTTRLITFLPVVCLFLFLPFILNSIHLGIVTVFFVSWLGNFKLLLFAFGTGPLSDPSLSVGRFIALACLPITIQQNSPCPSTKTAKRGLKSPLNYATKALLLLSLMFLNDHRESLPKTIILFITCIYIYICLDLLLTVLATIVRTMLGLELEPPFNDPHLSTSLQDLWANRWNLAVTHILRLTVYKPVLHLSKPILGRKWGPAWAVLWTFLVSGLMHELLLYYFCRAWPAWAAMYFFLLHGLLLVIEIALKKTLNCSWKVPQPISGPLVFGAGIIIFTWLITPQLTKCKVDLRGAEEYEMVGRFLKDVYNHILAMVF